MRGSILGFLEGRVTLSADVRDAEAILNVCMRAKLVYASFDVTADGARVVMILSARTAALLSGLCEKKGILLCEEGRTGLVASLYALFARPGLVVGIVFSLFLLTLARSYLWEVRVIGAERMSESEVLSELSLAGVSVGIPLRDLNVDAAENEILMRSEKISWVSVNVYGTVAEVQIREKRTPPAPESTAPANLVARCDGVIVSCEVLNGNVLVRNGSVVRKGEVLVSGIYDSNVLGFRYTRARGAVFAETTHEFAIEVPYLAERREYFPERTRYGLLFFGRTLRFPTQEDDAFSGAVREYHYLSLFGRRLPIGVVRETVYGENVTPETYSTERAMEIAYYRLSEALSALPDTRGMLEKKLSYEILEDRYVLHCTVRCVENIAEMQEIEIVLTD